MDRCAWCNLPKIAESSYGEFVRLLYDLYLTVKLCKEYTSKETQFLAQIEIEFLLQEIADIDCLSDPS